MKARKKYGVHYPDLYAVKSENEHADAFNCVQRGHQNALEMLSSFYVMLLTAGYRHPIASAVAGASYLVGRFLYARGYSTGDPKKRANGALFLWPGMLGLVGMSGVFAVELLMG